jgi:hypothetical protein
MEKNKQIDGACLAGTNNGLGVSVVALRVALLQQNTRNRRD